jgi:hypothetical protein
MARPGIWRAGTAAVAALLAGAVAVGGVAASGLDAGAREAQAAQALQAQKFSFGLWGDMPYANAGDNPKIAPLIQSMNDANLVFSAFLGDIKDGSSVCGDDQFTDAIDRFDQFTASMVYIPGDNEWTDCHRVNNGGYNNLERLDFMRSTMFARLESFGQHPMMLQHQAGIGEAYVENTRWIYGDVVFVGLNIPGSNNNKVNTPEECTNLSARTQDDCDADNTEYEAREAADIRWLQESFQLARQSGARGVMVIIQADPGFDLPETETLNERADPGRDGYTAFLDFIGAETQQFSGQVVLVHGDTHFFKVDKPLFDQAHLLPNLTRLETFGSPNIHWVKVDVDPSDPQVFAIKPMFVAANMPAR